KIIGKTIISAVADGAGSAKHSDIGAKVAVEKVLETFTEQNISDIAELFTAESIVSNIENKAVEIRVETIENLSRAEMQRHKGIKRGINLFGSKANSIRKSRNSLGKFNSKSNTSVTIAQFTNEQKARPFFSNIINKVIAALKEQAEKENYSIEDLACTLLIVIATPDGLAAMQIGDGFITVRYSEALLQLLFPPDKGEYINETTFVTSANALTEMQVVIQPKQPEFICASTDGLERLAIQISDWTPFAPFFNPLEQYLRETDNLKESDEYLMSFLNSERLNARTDDDKTLFLCMYDKSNSPQ
ncbi:MAG: PP2C family serine/threonine-protein phosphatase, partial [Waterburya sp.]